MGALMFLVLMVSQFFVRPELQGDLIIAAALCLITYAIEAKNND